MKRIFVNFYLFLLVTVAILEFGLGPLVQTTLENHLREQLTVYYRDLVKGSFYTLIEDLNRIPVEEWQQRTAVLRPHYGQEVVVRPLGEVLLPAVQRASLREGRIVVEGDGEIFHQRIGSGDWVLTMGPFPDFEPQLFWFEVLFWAVALLIPGIIALIWGFPFWRKLRIVSTAARAFGSGDFDTRARISARSSLAPLATAFNSMADRIQQLIQSHRELTNAVSHELRTPIARIRFGLEMATSVKQQEKREAHVAGIRRDLDELEALVDELLVYARLDRETPALEWTERKIASWLSEALAAEAVANDGLMVRTQIPSGLLETRGRLDPRYLQRALTNLLRNARRHARTTVEVGLSMDGGQLCLHVEDDGPGIPMADREMVFDPFVRLDDSRSRSSGGYGLGLAIVRRIARWHRGDVRVEDAALGGALFIFRWPGLDTDKQE